MFTKDSGIKDDTLNAFHARNALSAFVRSLSPVLPALTNTWLENKKALSEEQVCVFNLFAGKAKYTTCHFIPLFNGNIPPWLTKSESEIIGCRQSRSGIMQPSPPIPEGINKPATPNCCLPLKHLASRILKKPVPNMHNGVYKTLVQVVESYTKGGVLALE